MKKKLLRYIYITIFLAFSIALFSVESEKEKEVVVSEKEGAKSEVDRKGESILSEGGASEKKLAEDATSKENIKGYETDPPSKTQSSAESATPPKNISNTENAEEREGAQSAKDITKLPPTTQEVKSQEQRKEESMPQNADFASIQVTGLTIASGGKWYFEEYDEEGNIISKVSYNRNKMLSASTIQYRNGKRSSEKITEGKKIINVRYNNKGEEIGREELKSKKNGEEVAIASSANVYADNGKIKEESKTENGITTRRVYTYDKDKKASETVYENDVQTLFIEYKGDKKVVHIFDEGKEISVFTEDIEGGN